LEGANQIEFIAGGTMTTMIRRLEEWRRKPGFLDEEAMPLHYAGASKRLTSETSVMADFDGFLSQIDLSSSDRMPE
jgi:hypothetical protein